MKQPPPSLTVMVALTTALTAALQGCSKPAEATQVQRDVYTGPDALEKCMADWGNSELCQKQITAEEAKKMAAANRANGGGTPIIFFGNGYGLYGPGYVGDRSVTHNGTTYTPSRSRANSVGSFSSVARNAVPTSYTAPKPIMPSSHVTPVSPRGGFGSIGRSGFGGVSS